MTQRSIVGGVLECEQIIYTDHAIERMFEWGLDKPDIRNILVHGKVIEDYPEDIRGHSCLVFGYVTDEPIHICVGLARGPGICEVITVYRPDERWEADHTTRRKST